MRPDQFRFLEFCSTVRRRTTAAKILSTWVRAGRPRGRCVRRAKARRRCRSQTRRCVCVCVCVSEGERSGRGAWRRPRRRCTRTVLVLHSPAPPFARHARALRHNKGFLPIIACNDVTCAGVRRHWMAAGPSGAPPRRRKAQRVPAHTHHQYLVGGRETCRRPGPHFRAYSLSHRTCLVSRQTGNAIGPRPRP